MPRKGYRTVSVPEELIAAIATLIKQNPAMGRNPSEYVINAARSAYLNDLRLAQMGVRVKQQPNESYRQPE